MISKNNLLKILINTALGIGLFAVWLRFVDLNQIWGTLSKVSILSLLPIFLFFFLGNVVRSYKLKIFLQNIKKISLFDLVFLNGVSSMLSFMIPIRAGEIAKGAYLSQNYNLPIGKSLLWIFLDRFIDFLVIFICTAVMLTFIPTSLGTNFLYISMFIAIGLVVMIYLIVFQQNLARKLFDLIEKLLILNVLKKFFNKTSNFFLETFQILKRPARELLLIFALSILGYLADTAIWVYAFKAIGVDEDFSKMLLSQLLSALTYLIPAAPGYVGSAEASGLLIFSGIFGIETNIASSMIVLFHVCAALFIIIFGFISLYLIKFDLNSVWTRLRTKK